MKIERPVKNNHGRKRDKIFLTILWSLFILIFIYLFFELPTMKDISANALIMDRLACAIASGILSLLIYLNLTDQI